MALGNAAEVGGCLVGWRGGADVPVWNRVRGDDRGTEHTSNGAGGCSADSGRRAMALRALHRPSIGVVGVQAQPRVQ